MSSTTMQAHEHHHAHHFESADAEFEACKQGMWLFLVTEVLMLGGMFVAYGIFRGMYPHMFHEAHKMLNVNMGVSWDAPQRKLAIRPFVPWGEFRFGDLNYGSLQMDLKYVNTVKFTTVAVKHNQERLKELTIALRAPVAASGCTVARSSGKCRLKEGKGYFGRPTWEAVFDESAESGASVTVAWQ